MHIVLLNQAFHPDVAATAQMAKDLADHLVRRGHRVSAVASRSIYGQSGAVLPKREHIEVPDAEGRTIEVRRVGASIFGKRGIAARAADFLLFYIRAGWVVLTMPKADVVIGFTTPPFIALVGVAAKLLRRSRVIYWAMDLYPDVAVAHGLLKERSLSTRLFERVHRFILRHSDATVVLGRCMERRVLDKGAPPARVHLIPVWADCDELNPPARPDNPLRERWGLGDDFVVMYSGNLGLGHDAATICRAMDRLRDEPGVRFVFVGGGKRREEVERYIDEHGLTSAAYHDYQPREELAQSIGLADVHLISLSPEMEGLLVPSKLYGIMAAGRASIFIGPPGSEIARVLTETGCGLVVDPGDDEALAEAILSLAKDRAGNEAMGHTARAALQGRFDRLTSCSAWTDLIENVTGTPGVQPPKPSTNEHRKQATE